MELTEERMGGQEAETVRVPSKKFKWERKEREKAVSEGEAGQRRASLKVGESCKSS